MNNDITKLNNWLISVSLSTCNNDQINNNNNTITEKMLNDDDDVDDDDDDDDIYIDNKTENINQSSNDVIDTSISSINTIIPTLKTSIDNIIKLQWKLDKIKIKYPPNDIILLYFKLNNKQRQHDDINNNNNNIISLLNDNTKDFNVILYFKNTVIASFIIKNYKYIEIHKPLSSSKLSSSKTTEDYVKYIINKLSVGLNRWMLIVESNIQSKLIILKREENGPINEIVFVANYSDLVYLLKNVI